jgi:drug/metabolite transporter (DMT)-like permease
MNNKIKGILCGIVSAITYGTNPLGALNLYAENINVNSVLLYRYGLAVLILGCTMLITKTGFKISGRELYICLFLGVMFAISSLTLFSSFHYMDAGVASTILFVYPVMVAVLMAVFFKEKVTFVTVLSILLALAGIGLLYRGGNGTTLSLIGVLLVLASSLTYAVYIITVNKSGIELPPAKMTFYVMLFGVSTIIIHSFFSPEYHLQLLHSASSWAWAFMLAIVPTVLSLSLMVVAVREIGSTPTAIMGALEPVTAVIIGILVFHEVFTLRLGIGILMILGAVLLIIGGKALPSPKLLSVKLKKHHR